MWCLAQGKTLAFPLAQKEIHLEPLRQERNTTGRGLSSELYRTDSGDDGDADYEDDWTLL